MNLLTALFYGILATTSNDPESYCRTKVDFPCTWWDDEYRTKMIDGFRLGDVL